MKSEKLDQCLLEMYRRTFAASTPPADFDQLLENATINSLGQKEIPYLEHECDEEVMQQITEAVMDEYKVPKRYRKKLFTTFWLGCSPKSLSKYE
jgi:hypothetical protein